MRVSPLAGCKARFLPGMSFPTLCKAQVFPSSAGRIPREGEERLPRADKSPPKQAAGEEDSKQPPPGGRGMSFASPYFTWRNASICLSPPDERAGPREGKKRHPPRRHPASRLQQGQQSPPPAAAGRMGKAGGEGHGAAPMLGGRPKGAASEDFCCTENAFGFKHHFCVSQNSDDPNTRLFVQRPASGRRAQGWKGTGIMMLRTRKIGQQTSAGLPLKK